MDVDWATVDQVVDDVVITVGIAFLIVRQFVWRSTQVHRMLRLPVLVIAAGLVYLVVDLVRGVDRVPADWIILGELALVAVTGTIMGRVTRFRRREGELEYKLRTAGVWLWALFLAIRVGFFALAAALGANLAEATGLILLSFGVNRIAAILVVQRRAEAILAAEGEGVPAAAG